MHAQDTIQEEVKSTGIPDTATVTVLNWFESSIFKEEVLSKGTYMLSSPKKWKLFHDSIHEFLLEELKAESHKKRRGFLHRQLEELEPVCLALGHILRGLNLSILSRSEKDMIIMELLDEKILKLSQMDELQREFLELGNSITSLPYPVLLDNNLFEYLASEQITDPAESEEVLSWVLEYHGNLGGKAIPARISPARLRKMLRYFSEKSLFREETEKLTEDFSGQDLDLFLEKKDHSFGLANLPDREIEKTMEKMNRGISELLEEGEISEGKYMSIPEFPFRYLRKIPIVDGSWIDAGIAAILEWFGMLEEKGYRIMTSPDDHAMAFPVIYTEDQEGNILEEKDPLAIGKLLEELEKLTVEIEDYPWKSCIIRGRKHIFLDKYLSWDKKRWDLPYSIKKGIKTRTWNEWVRLTESEEKNCRISEIPVRNMLAIVPERDISIQGQTRNIPDHILRRNILRLLGKRQFPVSYPDIPGSEDEGISLPMMINLTETASRIREDLEDLSIRVIAEKIALARISRDIFSGQAIQIPTLKTRTRQQLSQVHALVDNYNQKIVKLLWDTAPATFRPKNEEPLIKWDHLFPKGIEISLESMKEQVQQLSEKLISNWTTPLAELNIRNPEKKTANQGGEAS